VGLATYQKQVLMKLKGIRETLVSEIGNVSEIKESREVAVSENAELKKEVERLKYRIQILVKSLEEEENKNRSKA
jgi:regulator of replication initiation timing